MQRYPAARLALTADGPTC